MLHPLSAVVPLLLLLPNLLLIRYPFTGAPPRASAGLLQLTLTAAETVGRMGVLLAPLFYPLRLDGRGAWLALAFMLFALLSYYSGWVRYIRSDRQYKPLFAPMLGLPVPMAVFPCLYALAVSVLFDTYVLAAFAVLFAVGHIGNSLRTRRKLLVEE